MTGREFRRLMMIYGADLRRWPASRLAAAEKWQAAHPEFGGELRRTAEMDRLLRDVAPLVESSRVDRVMEKVLRKAEEERAVPELPASLLPPFAVPLRVPWLQRRWAPQGMLYLGLFFLGCAANLAVRLLTAETPLDLWFASNLSLPLGG
ncbi:hypothetical protein [Telmatospirillum siberiense]|uniref:Uncharacterized protein n=1 Tax=Telmatospirillum siberiense TaxID=382514 RepID=A0A2N3PXB0_9PROT|nr:hypothetical protein [Telmatospirillum siberiense]PKU25015.1 hypothetical protein CWS72_09135 [Telmatospirillum siberiense]